MPEQPVNDAINLISGEFWGRDPHEESSVGCASTHRSTGIGTPACGACPSTPTSDWSSATRRPSPTPRGSAPTRAYSTSKAALERLIEGWRTGHPWLRFTTVTVGATFPTDFGHAFEAGLLDRALTDWIVRGLAQEEFMTPADVADVLAAMAAATVGRPGVGVDHLTIRSPSPVVGTFAQALATRGAPAEPGALDG
jgi:NAD(P)-dependent dehydrogenase (short-subunit alcohol dehydrogenase family)